MLLADELIKTYWTRTHRVCSPEETEVRVRPLLREAGITRVADVTWLDAVGIPTWQAVRPRSYSLSVSQGKGVSHAAARVSAIMESLELWHGETISTAVLRESVGTMRNLIGYDVHGLGQPRPSLLNDATQLAWLGAQFIRSNGVSWVPRAFIDMDSRVREDWEPPLLSATSNGLASGNTIQEAMVHGLFEVIERECTTRLHASAENTWLLVDPATVDGMAQALLDRFDRASNRVEIFDATGPMGVACFLVRAWSPVFPVRLVGAGCHFDREVALCRAITEAAQSRLTLISGVRDDLKSHLWLVLGDHEEADYRAHQAGHTRSFADVPSRELSDPSVDAIELAMRIENYTGVEPLMVDLSRDDRMACVKVVAPGLLFDETGTIRYRHDG